MSCGQGFVSLSRLRLLPLTTSVHSSIAILDPRGGINIRKTLPKPGNLDRERRRHESNPFHPARDSRLGFLIASSCYQFQWVEGEDHSAFLCVTKNGITIVNTSHLGKHKRRFTCHYVERIDKFSLEDPINLGQVFV